MIPLKYSGLSIEDRKTLVDSVNIVFHAAASVRFDDPLKDAVIMNTRGTREMMLLARDMKRIEVNLRYKIDINFESELFLGIFACFDRILQYG
jgi:hypothetical protein